jgi:aminoglycoside/choline kinase family phosphotransferase
MKPIESERLFIEGLIKDSAEKNNVPKSKLLGVTALTGDASTRRYYRVKAEKNSYVACLTDPSEKSDFVIVQDLLSKHNIRVPKIYDKNLSKGFLLEEDLGDTTLLVNLSSQTKREEEYETYKSIIDELIKIHKIQIGDSAENYATMSFDEEKLSQEINMTHEYFLDKYLSTSIDDSEWDLIKKGFEKIYKRIASEKMVLTHRDFHSRNIMVKNDELIIIDFQDARLGLPQYDLVSLLEDCYYQLNRENVDKLKKYYWENFLKETKMQKTYEDFLYLYDLMAIQRVYKAIGSFTYIYDTRKDARYLKYVGFAFEKIRRIFNKYPEFNELKEVLSRKYYES